MYELSIDLRDKETKDNMLYLALDIELSQCDDYREMAEKLLDLAKRYINIID